jgi:hypothetical protein
VVTAAPSKQLILKCSKGKYEWWPLLGVVDYTPHGKQKHVQIGTMDINKDKEEDALFLAVKHLYGVLRYLKK